jgi:site-specific recombinase XerD
MRTRLTPAFVAKATAEANAERTVYWDESLKGFGLMVTAAGHKSWVCQYRANGISRRFTVKSTLSLLEARREAKGVLGAVARGGDPLQDRRRKAAEAAGTLRAIAEDYLAREHALRSIGDRRKTFERYIYPEFGARSICSIRRSEIVRLLDRIEDGKAGNSKDRGGPVAAQHTLATLRRLFSWHASRDDDFRSPIVRGMSRIKPKEMARTRILSDDELRAVWRVAQRHRVTYSNMLRFILLTATRLREAADMRRGELSDDEWTIPAARYKGKHEHLIPLSQAAQTVLAEQPVIGRKGWVFTTNGDVPISGFSKFKREFDVRVVEELRKGDPEAKPLARWTVHDLRRTARSLMSRAGVDPDHAERTLGHVVGGVRGVYDRHEFKEEKRRAFEALAALVERIVDPQDKVIHFRKSDSTNNLT